MRAVRILFGIAIVACVPATVWANGLIYKLPADGSQAVYEMTTHFKQLNLIVNGTLTLSSVGKAKAGGKECRWIEITTVMSIMGREQTLTAKVLVPEEDLGKGKNPLKNPQKGWILRPRGAKPKEIRNFTSPEAGPLPAFLTGPLAGAKKLEAEEVETGLGKLKCAGESGTYRLKQGNNETEITYTNRLNAKSPFGVVYSRMIAKEARNGQAREEAEMTFRLKSVSKNAKSRLADKN